MPSPSVRQSLRTSPVTRPDTAAAVGQGAVAVVKPAAVGPAAVEQAGRAIFAVLVGAVVGPARKTRQEDANR